MSKIVGVLLAGAAGLGLVTLHLVSELRDERARSAVLQAELDAARGSVASTSDERVAAVAPVESTAPPKAPPRTLDRNFTIAGGPVVGAPVFMRAGPGQEEMIEQMRAMRERQETLLQDPAYRAATIAQYKSGLRTMQQDIGRAIGLSDEQSDKLLDLLAEQQLVASQQSTFDWTNQDPDAARERARKYQELHERQAREVAALLGPEGYRNYQEYQATLGARQMVNHMNVGLAAASVPLNAEQVQQLTRVLHEQHTKGLQASIGHQQRWANGATPPSQLELQKMQIDLMREQSKRTRAAAARILTDDQMEVFAAQQDREIESMDVQFRLMQAQEDAVARGIVPPLPSQVAGAVGVNQVFTSPTAVSIVTN